MHDFARAEEADGVPHVRFVAAEAQNVVVRHAGFLLRREVFVNIRQRVARRGKPVGVEGLSACVLRIDARGVVDEIGVVAGRLDLLRGQVAGQLVHDGADHFEVAELLCADVRQNRFQLGVRHGVALAEVAQRSADFTVRAAVCRNAIPQT